MSLSWKAGWIDGEASDYSSGISDKVGIFKLKYHELSKREKLKRVMWLWRKTYAKAKGASTINHKKALRSKLKDLP